MRVCRERLCWRVESHDLNGRKERSWSCVRSGVSWTVVVVEGIVNVAIVRLRFVIRARAISRRGFNSCFIGR